jgi:hypothetical protein
LRVCVVTILEVCNYDMRKGSESARVVAMRESRESRASLSPLFHPTTSTSCYLIISVDYYSCCSF